MSYKMNKNLYSSIIKEFPENIVITDLEGNVLDASKNFTKFFGFDSREEIIGKNGFDLLSPKYNNRARKDLLNTLILRTQKNFEYEFLNRDGTKIYCEISSSVVKSKNGNPKCVTAVFRDVTDVKKIEKEQKEIQVVLRKSQEMFQLVMDNIPQFISWKDINSVYLGCNSNFARIAGIKDPIDLIGKTDYDLAWKKSESESFFETDQLVMELDKPEYHIIEPQLQADGKQAWLDINKIPLHDTEGQVVGLLSTFEDITERVIVEENLRNSEKKYRKLYESMLDGFISLTIVGRIVEFNLALKNMLGYDEEEIHDLTVKDITPKKWHSLEDFVIHEQLLAKGFSQLYEKEYRKKDGTIIPVELRKYLIRDDDDNALGVWAIVRDITERKKAEEELKKSELKYRKAYNLAEFYKDIFAHDISNILQGILTSVEICRYFVSDAEKLKETLNLYEIIKDEVSRGANLVSNVRKLSLIRDFEDYLNQIDVYEILRKEVNHLRKNHQNRSMDVKIDTIGEKFYAMGNNMLSDVFENILLNAVKYNENSIVEIMIKLSKIKRENLNFVKIEFIDNGIGIPDVQKKIIFQKDLEVQKTLSRIGLGLSLAKNIIEAYNGNIWVEDKVKGNFSEGSNFVILIPEAL